MSLRWQPPAFSPVRPGEMLQAVRTVVAPAGNPSRDLERLLADEYEADRVVLCGSGTQALQLALTLATSAKQDAPVALPAFGCYDLVAAAVGAGVKVSFYDIDPNTLAPDFSSLETVLRTGVSAVVATPLYGIPIPWDRIAELAGLYDVPLIEDAAQGHGGRWNGRALGANGALSVLSFGRGKGWTGGGGGALLLRGSMALAYPIAVAALLPAPAGVSRIGAAAAQWALGNPSVYAIPASIPWLGLGETRYHEPVAPTGCPRASAALALASFDAARAEADVRRRNGAAFAEALATGSARPIRPPTSSDPGYVRFPVRVRDAHRTVERLRRLGVAQTYPTILPELPAARPRLCTPAHNWQGARALVRELVTLPTHSKVSAAELRELMLLLEQDPRCPTSRL